MAFSGCAVRPFVVDQTAQALSSQPVSSEDDLQLAREASAFYLKFSESVLKETPSHLKLAESVSAGFTQYAYAFVAFDAEKIDAKQPKTDRRGIDDGKMRQAFVDVRRQNLDA